LKRARGRSALLMVVLTTAIVIAPLVILGIYLGYAVGDETGYSKSILAIAFSTVGFLGGMAVVFRVIGSVVSWVDRGA